MANEAWKEIKEALKEKHIQAGLGAIFLFFLIIFSCLFFLWYSNGH